MQIKNILTTGILALAGTALVSSAQATTYVDGDLFLGFRATTGQGNTNAYLINIGNYLQYRDASIAGFTLPLGNIKADLDATFSSSWSSLSTVKWSVVGLTQLNDLSQTNVLFGTKREITLGVHPVSWAKRSDTQQGLTGGKVLNAAQEYTLDTGTGNSGGLGVIENTTEPNDWTEFLGGSQSTASTAFSVWTLSTYEGDFGSGATSAGAQLDLYNIPNTTDTGAGNGAYIGTFSIDAGTGAVTYKGTVVPEPASALLLGMGTCLLGFVRRRQAVTL